MLKTGAFKYSRMCISESAYAETIRRIELAFQEFAADVLNFSQLQQARRGKKRLHVGLLDDYVRRVAEVDKQFHSVLVNVPYGDFRLAGLFQFAREHGPEVRRAC